MSLHGEEVYKYLIYLNDAYKRAIIDSQGQEESYWDVENSLNTLLWNGRGCAFGGQYGMQKTEQSWGMREIGKNCKAALLPFVDI